MTWRACTARSASILVDGSRARWRWRSWPRSLPSATTPALRRSAESGDGRADPRRGARHSIWRPQDACLGSTDDRCSSRCLISPMEPSSSRWWWFSARTPTTSRQLSTGATSSCCGIRTLGEAYRAPSPWDSRRSPRGARARAARRPAVPEPLIRSSLDHRCETDHASDHCAALRERQARQSSAAGASSVRATPQP